MSLWSLISESGAPSWIEGILGGFLIKNTIMVIDSCRNVLDKTDKQSVTLCSTNKFDFKNQSEVRDLNYTLLNLFSMH